MKTKLLQTSERFQADSKPLQSSKHRWLEKRRRTRVMQRMVNKAWRSLRIRPNKGLKRTKIFFSLSQLRNCLIATIPISNQTIVRTALCMIAITPTITTGCKVSALTSLQQLLILQSWSLNRSLLREWGTQSVTSTSKLVQMLMVFFLPKKLIIQQKLDQDRPVGDEEASSRSQQTTQHGVSSTTNVPFIKVRLTLEMH